MNGALQTGGFVFALIGFVLGMIAIILPEWRVNDPRGDIIEAIFLHQGLWARCVAQTTGQWQCDDWDAKFLGLSAELQVARSLAIICVFFGIGALLLSVLGLECSSCLSDSISTKSKVSQLASALWIGAGITVGAAVSFYAHQIATAFQISNVQSNASGGNRNTVWVFGNSIFLGWAAMIIGVIGGLLMLCGSFHNEDDNDDYMNRTRVGGVRRMRESFRESYRALRPRPAQKEADYV